MRILISTVAIVAFGLIGMAQDKGIQFSDLAFKDALKQSAQEGKPVFIDFYAVWCGPCKMMDKKVFKEEEIGSLMNDNFINLKIDVDRGEGKALANKYKITGMPTYVFLDANGEVVHRSLGYMAKKDFKSEAEFAQRKYKKGKKKGE